MELQNLQFCRELGYKRPPHRWEVGGWILTKPGGELAVASNPALEHFIHAFWVVALFHNAELWLVERITSKM